MAHADLSLALRQPSPMWNPSRFRVCCTCTRKSLECRDSVQGIVREAIRMGADAVEIEYRDGFEDVVAYLGSLGRQLARLRSGSADAVALRRDLSAWKARPRSLTVEGESRIIRTQVWDSFGEDAFRISLGQPNKPLQMWSPQRHRRKIAASAWRRPHR